MMLTQRIGAMELDDIQVDDGDERIFYNKVVDVEDGKQYKGQW